MKDPAPLQIEINCHSGIYTLKAKQFIAADLDACWNFFSSPENLGEITPENMKMEITSPEVPAMFAGQLITYRIGIFPGIKSNWVTEITHVKHRSYFIDEQRFGPYAMWHHIHKFEEIEGGVLMTDEVSYKLPMGSLGRLFGSGYVRKQIREIFEYRGKVIGGFF
jgi:ligand-binding SRPBCC domain-containing protein